MGSKDRKQKKGKSAEAKGSSGVAAADEGKQMIKDPRFSSAHTDPRFRRVPRRESKVTIDPRFQGIFTDKRFDTATAPVDKRGKKRRGKSGKDSLREYYRLEKEVKKPKKDKEDSKEESEDDGDSDDEIINLKSKSKRRKSEKSSDTDSEEDETKSEKSLASLDEESDENSDSEEENDEELSEEEEEEVDTDEDDEAMYDDGPEIPEENIPTIPEETHRLAIVNMDWRHVSAKDLYVVLNSFVPKDGHILSVAVYPTEFGLERMKEEEIHGPVIDGDKKNDDNDDEEEDDEEEEEEDEDVINQKLRAYETSRLKYYFAVAECDSSATADYLYKSCDGIEFERSSNKLDLRFIPDSMEFKHPPRDISTEAPAGYEGLDFQTQALQMSKVNLSWDEDEPHRVKTLNQKFKPEQLADLEMKEFLASDESESDDDEDSEVHNRSKEEKRKDKYRALIESEDVDSDKDVEEDNDQDMEVTFNTGLEDLSKEILKKKDKKSESVWEAYLRQKREKKRARKNKQKADDSSDDDDDDYNIDGKSVKDDGDDDFFMEEPAVKKKKEGKMKKKKGLEEEVAAEERSRAELELLLADENEGAANGLKGYNIKRKGKKGKTDIDEKVPAADLDDPRFSALLSSPSFALDPTDPQFKRSATYVRQLAAKQKEEPRSHEDVKETAPKEKQELNLDGNLESKKEKHSLTSTVKSLKMKMLNKDSDKKKTGNALSSPTLAQRIKKKAKDLSNK